MEISRAPPTKRGNGGPGTFEMITLKIGGVGPSRPIAVSVRAASEMSPGGVVSVRP
jgi:hypothetical protein